MSYALLENNVGYLPKMSEQFSKTDIYSTIILKLLQWFINVKLYIKTQVLMLLFKHDLPNLYTAYCTKVNFTL